MSLLNILQTLISSPAWWIGVVIVLSLIQISPIKLDPWTWIGNAFNKDVLDKMNQLEKRIDKVEEGVDAANKKCDKYSAQREEDKVVATRRRILNFNDELVWRDKPHSKETFDQVLKDITYYENYCDAHKGFCNSQANAAIRNINREYDERCKDHSFMNPEQEKEIKEHEREIS